MKTLKSFGFSIVNAGKRVKDVNPELILTSSIGNFRITAPVSKALGLQNGDYIMFINTHDDVDAAIANKNADAVAACEAQGFAIDSEEAYEFLHEEFGHVLLAKGIIKVDSMGNPLKCQERISNKQKVAYVMNNYDEAYAAAINSDNEELVASITRDGITKEEVVEILAKLVSGKEVDDYQGSKVAQASDLAGTDVSLNFNDTAMWKYLKKDLSDEEKTNISRTFAVDTELIEVPYTRVDGKEIIIPCVELKESKDVVRQGKEEVEE